MEHICTKLHEIDRHFYNRLESPIEGSWRSLTLPIVIHPYYQLFFVESIESLFVHINATDLKSSRDTDKEYFCNARVACCALLAYLA